MPLISAKDFPMNPQPRGNQINEAIINLIGGIKQKRQSDALLQAKTAQKQAKTDAAQFARVRNMDDYQAKRREIGILGQAAIKEGRDPTVFMEALNAKSNDELNMFMSRNITSMANSDKQIAEAVKKYEPQSPQGKVQADVQAGLLTPEQAKPAKQGGLASAKTELFVSGAIQGMPDGSVDVKNAQGQSVYGEERTQVLANIRQESIDKAQSLADVEIQKTRDIAQVKAAEKTSSEAFDMVDKIRGNITNLEQVIPLVGQGANTGPIEDLFPSFKAETIRLKQLQKRLALDVIGSVTFGALSQGELDLANAVALPTTLEGDALIKHVTDQITAQKKVATYLEDQAIFLSQGKTKPEWLKFKRAEKREFDKIIKSAGVSEQDIQDTMTQMGWSRKQVIDELKRRQ